jgi:hypothetical protein
MLSNIGYTIFILVRLPFHVIGQAAVDVIVHLEHIADAWNLTDEAE